jgi:dipeptidase D
VSATALPDLEPALLWTRFRELTSIPRPPGQEEEARAHVLAWAGARGHPADVDAAGNVVVRVSAAPGRESAPTVVLQAHLDMVCERDPDSPHDARAGRIHAVVDGDWVAAVGTTLGADNGIGVAAALAAAEDPAVVHGPLELLFTVSEEQGLTGAKSLAGDFVAGRLLLNLDGTSDRALTIGCAGSVHTFTRLALHPAPPGERLPTLALTLAGARGGHSGADIARGRANAIKALGRLLSASRREARLLLARLDGGVSRNALPRAARAVVAVDADHEQALAAALERELAGLREQYAGTDDGLQLSVERVTEEPVAGADATAAALDLLAALPSGVVALSPALPGTVETSTSLNVATTRDGVLTLASMTRSANAAALDDVLSTIEGAARLAGADVEVLRSYPPWAPDPGSPLLATAKRTFERVNGFEPALEVVHGGLECAVIGERLPGVQMLALGPEIVDAHAPGERVSISGTARFYRLLGALLEEVSS